MSLLVGVVRSPVSVRRFEIKQGYRHRKAYFHFDASSATDEAQREVYEIARTLAVEKSIHRVLDVGCGSAYKLVKIFSEDYRLAGTEMTATLSFLRTTYPDLEFFDSEKVDYSAIEAELVICSDVIEHVLDPNALLEKIRSVKGFKYLAISTPDRLLARGWFDFGPPNNPTHVREWSGKEFARYIQSQGFDIISHQITRYEQHTQLIICKPV